MRAVAVSALLIAIVLGAILIAGCTQAETKAVPSEIKIGAMVSITGPASNVGNNMWQSAVVAADEINANGGVFVKEYNTKLKIRLIQGDDESTREGGQKAAMRLVSQDAVDLMVGGYSSAVTSAYQQTIAQYGVPFIVTGASSPIITHRTDVDTNYTFHYCPTTDNFGLFTTTFIDEVFRPALNSKFNFTADRPLRLALIYQDSPYGKGVQTAVNDTITRNNLNVQLVSQQAYKMGESDFRTVLTSVKAAKPDVVYVAAFPNEQSQMIPQARRDVQLNTIFFAVENNDAPEYYTGIGKFGEYSAIESRFSPYTSPKGPVADAANAFKEKYKARWGSYPDMMGASTYEGMYVAAKAVENAGTLNKTAVRDAIGTLRMPQMIEAMKDGTISFTPDYREGQFQLYMEQLLWDPAVNETRPTIIWPEDLKAGTFGLPDWYTPGSE